MYLIINILSMSDNIEKNDDSVVEELKDTLWQVKQWFQKVISDLVKLSGDLQGIKEYPHEVVWFVRAVAEIDDLSKEMVWKVDGVKFRVTHIDNDRFHSSVPDFIDALWKWIFQKWYKKPYRTSTRINSMLYTIMKKVKELFPDDIAEFWNSYVFDSGKILWKIQRYIDENWWLEQALKNKPKKQAKQVSQAEVEQKVTEIFSIPNIKSNEIAIELLKMRDNDYDIEMFLLLTQFKKIIDRSNQLWESR